MDNRAGALPGDDDDLVPMLISDNSARGLPDVVSLGIIHDTGGTGKGPCLHSSLLRGRAGSGQAVGASC